MQIIILGRARAPERRAFLIKYLSMAAVTSKSAITPSFRGRTATIEPGVRPSISLACLPTASTSSVRTSTATTEGSRMTMPLPRMNTRVFAVPRSMPISFENMENIERKLENPAINDLPFPGRAGSKCKVAPTKVFPGNAWIFQNTTHN